MRLKNASFCAHFTIFEVILISSLKFTVSSTTYKHNVIGYGRSVVVSGRQLDSCQAAGRPGDCNPEICAGVGRYVCESRYTRFWDGKEKVDRTQKSCQCIHESICGLFGVAFYGCRSYSALSPFAQTIIRKWTLSRKERRSRYQSRLSMLPLSPLNRSRNGQYNVVNSSRRVWSNSAPLYSDRDRHNQLLLMANTRFCCRTSVKALPLAEAVTTSGTNLEINYLRTLFLLVIIVGYVRKILGL